MTLKNAIDLNASTNDFSFGILEFINGTSNFMSCELLFKIYAINCQILSKVVRSNCEKNVYNLKSISSHIISYGKILVGEFEK